jgi:hypothetical protein
VRVRVGDGEGRVSDLAHAGQALDVECIVGDERTKSEPLGCKGGLIVHEMKIKRQE